MLGKRKALTQTTLSELVTLPAKKKSSPAQSATPKTVPTKKKSSTPVHTSKRAITPEVIKTYGDTPTQFSSDRETRLVQMKAFVDSPLFFFESHKDKICGEPASLTARRVTSCLPYLHIIRAVALERQIPEFEMVWELMFKICISRNKLLDRFNIEKLEAFFKDHYQSDFHEFAFRNEDGTLSLFALDSLSGLNVLETEGEEDGEDSQSGEDEESELLQEEEPYSKKMARLKNKVSKAFARDFKEQIKTHHGFQIAQIGALYVQTLDWIFCGGCKWLYRMVVTILLMFFKDSRISLYNPRKFSVKPSVKSSGKEPPIDKTFVELFSKIPQDLKEPVHFISKYLDRLPPFTKKKSLAPREDPLLLLEALELSYITGECHTLAVNTYQCFIYTSRMDMVYLFIENNFIKRSWGSNDPYTTRSDMTFAINSFLASCKMEELTFQERKELNVFQEKYKFSGTGGNWKLYPKVGSFPYKCLYEHGDGTGGSGGFDHELWNGNDSMGKEGQEYVDAGAYEELCEAFEALKSGYRILQEHNEESIRIFESKFSSSARVKQMVSDIRSMIPKPPPAMSVTPRRFGSKRTITPPEDNLSAMELVTEDTEELPPTIEDPLPVSSPTPTPTPTPDVQVKDRIEFGDYNDEDSEDDDDEPSLMESKPITSTVQGQSSKSDNIPWLSKSVKSSLLISRNTDCMPLFDDVINNNEDGGNSQIQIRARKRRSRVAISSS